MRCACCVCCALFGCCVGGMCGARGSQAGGSGLCRLALSHQVSMLCLLLCLLLDALAWPMRRVTAGCLRRQTSTAGARCTCRACDACFTAWDATAVAAPGAAPHTHSLPPAPPLLAGPGCRLWGRRRPRACPSLASAPPLPGRPRSWACSASRWAAARQGYQLLFSINGACVSVQVWKAAEKLGLQHIKVGGS